MSVVVTENLTRQFGQVKALDAVSLQLPKGGVIGLVGPNGSGKSTLIRTLLGLIRATSGTAEVLGHSTNRPGEYASRVGVLIENPAFVGSLSAEKNLLSLAALRGIPASRVGQVLKQVGLAGREHEPVRSFSLGMKQRLGIASALLTSPDLLILDEPTNGLDPAGIVEIRSLLKSLVKEGRTVVVSSHLLSELESICDHLVIIRFGKVLFNGPMSQMLERTGAYIDIDTERDADRSVLAKALKATGWKVDVTADGLRVHAVKNRSAELNRFASESKITLVRIAVAQESLEDLFLEMTGRTDGELAESRAAAKGRTK